MLSQGAPVPEGCRTGPTLLVPLCVRGRLCLWEPQASPNISFQPLRMVTGLTPTRSCWLWVRAAWLEGRVSGALGVPQPLSCLRSPSGQRCLLYLACCPHPRRSHSSEFAELAESLLHSWVGTAQPQVLDGRRSFQGHRHSNASPAPSFVSSGVANVLGSFVSSYPITGSFGRWVAGGGAGHSW